MEQYTYSGENGNSYQITLDNGKTEINLGLNQDGLIEKWIQDELFTSDSQRKIIVTYLKKFFTQTGIEVIVPNVNTKFIVELTGDRYDFFDQCLGVPVIRKLMCNSIMEDNGLPKFFDQDQLLGLA